MVNKNKEKEKKQKKIVCPDCEGIKIGSFGSCVMCEGTGYIIKIKKREY